jgi:hypothetical protein
MDRDTVDRVRGSTGELWYSLPSGGLQNADTGEQWVVIP